MLSGARLVHTSRIIGCRVEAEVQAEILLLGLHPVLLVPSVLAHQRPFPHQKSTSCHVPLPSHEFRTKCSSDTASRLHWQPLINLFVSLAALTSWSRITAKIDSPNTDKADAYGVPTNIGMACVAESCNPNVRFDLCLVASLQVFICVRVLFQEKPLL